MPKKNRPHGHYCKICGQYKANEKFSGKGHAAHICKSCSRLSAADKAEAMTMNRLMNLPMRRLSDSEKKWLQNRVHDKRPEVAALAREVFKECFPHAERNAMKKQLIIDMLSFELHMEVCNEYGDFFMVNQSFTADRKSRVLTMKDFDTDEPEQSVTLDGGAMTKLLRWIVHSLEIFMWEQDYSLVFDDFSDEDFDGEGNAEEDVFLSDIAEPDAQETQGEPCWLAHVEYTNGAVQDIKGYDEYLPERPQELYLFLWDHFEPEDIDSEEW